MSWGSFPVEEAVQVMLVTDQGKLIRTPMFPTEIPQIPRWLVG